ncbi:hypothetical protein AJ80_00236 [Polytolypa hystricis UAMH7299]|uniref:Uncharacterized protein n=1 Tax=Polytolypa hystricis (strain UAMH7299) TaxID=1447883 RepID=A0A2B7Z4K7_POLH7|nr:hypothetical protein AJ80_00236 [Polytolypa hystricis UAMH7299]
MEDRERMDISFEVGDGNYSNVHIPHIPPSNATTALNTAPEMSYSLNQSYQSLTSEPHDLFSRRGSGAGTLFEGNDENWHHLDNQGNGFMVLLGLQQPADTTRGILRHDVAVSANVIEGAGTQVSNSTHLDTMVDPHEIDLFRQSIPPDPWNHVDKRNFPSQDHPNSQHRGQDFADDDSIQLSPPGILFAESQHCNTNPAPELPGGSPSSNRISKRPRFSGAFIPGSQRCEKRKDPKCWRCIVTHEGCVGGTPCDKCSKILHSRGHHIWKMTCTRAYLEDSARFLYPDTLTKSIQPKWLYDNLRRRFDVLFWMPVCVPVTVGFGDEIELWGRKLRVRSNEFTEIRGLGANSNGETSVFKTEGLPLTMDSPNRNTVRNIASWINDVVNNRLSSWVNFISKNNDFSWILGVMQAVQRYYETCSVSQAPPGSSEPFDNANPMESDEDRTLRLALKMAISATLMAYRVQISEHANASLWREVCQRDPPENDNRSFPRMMNKFFKFCVFRFLISVSKKVLSQLDRMLRAKDKAKEGHVFGILILLTIAVSITQVSLLDTCFLNAGDIPTKVRDEISELEEQLHNIPVEVFHRKYRLHCWAPGSQKRPFPELDPQTQQLVIDILPVQGFDDCLLQLDTFKTMIERRGMKKAFRANTPRLLYKLFAPLFGGR